MKDGGPAFPFVDKGLNISFVGMSLRDWFAGQVLASMKLPTAWSDNRFYWEGVARSAYVCADALLAAREKDLTHPPA